MGQIDNILPEDLKEILNSLDFEEMGGIVIESVNFNENAAVVNFAIRYNSENCLNQKWRLFIKQIVTEKITSNWASSIALYDEHVLLLEYDEDGYAELYFNGLIPNPEKLYFNINSSVNLAFEGQTGRTKYFISPAQIERLSTQGYGLFARGPRPVLNIYMQCLKEHGIKANFIPVLESKQTNKELKLLEIGQSYFIGKDFNFERVL